MSERKYPLFSIAAVRAVLIKGNKILLVKRRNPPGKDKWCVPGGVVKAGEKIYEAAKRELLEETGLVAEPLGVIMILNDIVRDRDNKVLYHYLILDVLFDSKTISGVERAGGDAADVAWFNLEEALNRTDVSRTTKILIRRILGLGNEISKAVIAVEEFSTTSI